MSGFFQICQRNRVLSFLTKIDWASDVTLHFSSDHQRARQAAQAVGTTRNALEFHVLYATLVQSVPSKENMFFAPTDHIVLPATDSAKQVAGASDPKLTGITASPLNS